MRRFAGLLLLLSAVPSGAADGGGQTAALAVATPAPAAPACEASTPLTLVGADTATGETLFALPNGEWLAVELSPVPRARRFPGSARPTVGASSGSGPLFVLLDCGPKCLQAARWRDGALAAFGEPLLTPSGATTSATYDAGGAPWIVLHEASGPGVLLARAFRFEAGEWVAQGALRVTDVGHAGALAIPKEANAVVSGTGHFARGEEARYWLDGLPDIPSVRRGEVVPFGANAAAYVAADGVVYRTLDRGATWRRAVWTPWSDTVVQPWRLGEDYDCELPGGDRGLPLPLAWFDHRQPDATTKIVLSDMTVDGAWENVATVDAVLPGSGGASMEVTELLRLVDDRWVLFAGCDVPAGVPTVVLEIASTRGVDILRLPIGGDAAAPSPASDPPPPPR